MMEALLLPASSKPIGGFGFDFCGEKNHDGHDSNGADGGSECSFSKLAHAEQRFVLQNIGSRSLKKDLSTVDTSKSHEFNAKLSKFSSASGNKDHVRQIILEAIEICERATFPVDNVPTKIPPFYHKTNETCSDLFQDRFSEKSSSPDKAPIKPPTRNALTVQDAIGIISSDLVEERFREQSVSYMDKIPTAPTRTSAAVKKHVNFAIGADGNVKTETFMYLGASEKYAPVLYYKGKELSEIHKECKSFAKQYGEKNKDYIDSLHHLLDTKKSTESPPKQETMKDSLAVRTLVESKTRGLETHASPLLHTHSHWVVRIVLKAQEKLQGETIEQKEIKLRRKSLKASRRSRAFAVMIAQGDAIEAKRAMDQ